ncbi:GNAT family acetyltransferase [Pseudomonas oryzihabitans]|uniref:GNAT family acetyltransferase n=1 Tax=Pseudomonas oryzihabitans TaxID=47885 RepID=UPI002894AC93|nr:GNAT family acetyltransferase [Pseudomonas oryzihabitans]MDT3718581.1 GNAT family acetyltransferase [Pseudomonas oryzihabitans]
MHIRPFQPADTEAVVSLWQTCGLTRPWNDPYRDIERKLAEQPELFLVGEVDGTLMASAMVGNDGHRGWLYYLAVAPAHRRQGHARRLMETAERLLIERGCPKLHLMVRRENTAVAGFYAALGYTEVEAVTLGKRLIVDD